VRRLRLLAVGLLLLGLLVSVTGIGHAHVGSSASNDSCAVCVHARSVAVAPQRAVVVAPIVLATPAPIRVLQRVAAGCSTLTRGRAPPRSLSSSC